MGIKICPECKSKKIIFVAGGNVGLMECYDCKFRSSIFPEVEEDKGEAGDIKTVQEKTAEKNINKKANTAIAKLATKEEITWCPGCPNFMILEAVKRVIAKLISEGEKQENFAMTTDIGCNSKIYDYVNISGIYGLHGRSLPTGLGLKLGNPNLKVLSFVGDGGIYDEGGGHLIHAGRYNADMVLIVHDNQSFSLTTGQPTATSQQGYKSKANPFGVSDRPLNPLRLALASNIGFIARCNARDIEHTAEVLEKALKYNGFAFVEVLQDCLIFNKDINNKDKSMYKIQDNKDIQKAYALAGEWDYNKKDGKIPIGVIYKEEKPSLTEKWSQLSLLKKKKTSWKGLKR
jgi:2-oxoglutarate ferredoxin oxidoreductase subunit beta